MTSTHRNIACCRSWSGVLSTFALLCCAWALPIPVAAQGVEEAAADGSTSNEFLLLEDDSNATPQDRGALRYGVDTEPIPAPAGEPAVRPESDAMAPSDGPLNLADVMASLYRSYPDIAIARREPERTSGEVLAAFGSYDTKLQGYSLSEPAGNFRNYRNGISLARQTWWGGYLSSGYRIGRGDIQPWYQERVTDKAGEFKLALGQPLLQGRAIDPQRLAVFQASLSRQAAEPRIQQAILDASREAAFVFWQWVAAGGVLEAQRELLSLAEKRGEQYQAGVKAGKFPEIDLILNQQLIAERRGKVLETEQKYRASAFKLSLFLRDENGQPVVPRDEWLPDRFPILRQPPEGNFQEDLALALTRRPEPRVLQLEIQQIEWERRLAHNELLPRLDAIAEASQDVGPQTTRSNNKGEFNLIVGLLGEVPIQRRKARGKIASTSAKIAQLREKLRFQQDKIAVELQTAYNAMVLSSQAVDQAELSLRAAIDTLDRYQFAFDRGKIDLIYLNLLETKTNETEIKLVEAQRGWFAALASMQAALGLDPLDQAMEISALPASTRPGPGHLPEPDDVPPEKPNL